MILNVDGSSLDNRSVSGFGGLHRNDDCVGYCCFCWEHWFSNIQHVELLAVYHGLKIAWEFGMLEQLCYSYSKSAIKLIKELVND